MGMFGDGINIRDAITYEASVVIVLEFKKKTNLVVMHARDMNITKVSIRLIEGLWKYTSKCAQSIDHYVLRQLLFC